MKSVHVAILGAGPTGLEAALAATDAGLSFTVYEAAPAVAGHVRSWGHVTLFSPWSMDVSPRMRRHLEAAGRRLPDRGESTCPTGHQLVESILAPVAALPRIGPHIETGVTVRAVGREGLLKHEEIGTRERARHPFRLLLERGDGTEMIAHANVVLDCTGTYRNPNSLGDAGIAAPGERALDSRIRRHLPDFFADPEVWAGKRVLLAGSGHSAQTAAVDLDRFAELHPETRVFWIRRGELAAGSVSNDDPLPERARLVARAASLANGKSTSIEAIGAVVVESLAPHEEAIEIALRHDDGTTSSLTVDIVLSLTGFVGDHSLYRQLQIHECYATTGPMKLSAALLGSASSDCLEQASHGADTLVNPEPHFFILGAKSYGRNSTFLMQIGWQQVEEVFSLLTQRQDGA
jgi:hypothetical protein